MMMEETGNLVLMNSFNGIMWQSFDHPADTLLRGQKLKVGHKLIANISPTNTSQGFYLKVDGFAMYMTPAPAQMYFRYPKQPATAKIAYLQLGDGALSFHPVGFPSNPITVALPAPENYLYLKFDSDGHLQIYPFHAITGKSVTDYFTNFNKELKICEYPRTRGDYGICADGICSCPRDGNAFALINASKPSLVCVPHSPLVCPEMSTISSSPQEYELLEMEQVSYFTYSFDNASTAELV
ncbi:hypothetical protein SUGI_0718510 [Cryptomeria japonica]|nr:hypothetical protein SUGI_0718510 [Cryptomeria japonica]